MTSGCGETTDRGPAAGQAGGVHEIQTRGITGAQVRRRLLGGHVFLQRDERIQTEDGVIEIADAGAVLETAIRVGVGAQERRDEIARLTQLLGRQPGDLQHLESQTHCTSP